MTWIKTTQPCPHCGSSRGFGLAEDHEHCFSCGHHKNFNSNSLFTIPSLATKKYAEWTGELPADFSRNFPTWCEVLLYNYFESIPQVLGYSEEYGRLIFPIYNDGSLKCWQGRGQQDQIPKWITSSPKYPWGFKFPYISPYSKNKSYVIVEDMISALKIELIAPTICILGSSINHHLTNLLLTYGMYFTIWLDGDQAGVSGTRKLLQNLGLYANIRTIRTENDPKFYSLKRIEELLK